MPIIESQDQARIEDIKHHHLVHRDPGNDNWRDIDALLAQMSRIEAHHQDEIEDLEDELRVEMAQIERDYEARIDNLRDELQDRERRVEALEQIARKQAERLASLDNLDHVGTLLKRLEQL